MTRIFLDMDGVLADYEKLRLHYKVTGDELKRMNNAFKEMEPIEGAIAGVNSLIGMGYEVWVASKPATGLPHTYADKATWILQHLPQLKRRIILTHDKGLLGCRDDYLVDDRPRKANCEKFSGRLVVFGRGPCSSYFPRAEDWTQLLSYFRHWNQRGLTGPAALHLRSNPVIGYAMACACWARGYKFTRFRRRYFLAFAQLQTTASFPASSW